MGKIILVTGGARSGKSSFAEKFAKINGSKLFFIATGQAIDKEMRERIKKHKRRRGNLWKVIEEPKRLSDALGKISKGTVVLDCITLWINNLIQEGLRDSVIKREVLKVLKIANKGKFDTIMVTNEVGYGIVPNNRLARQYRDLLGAVNQLIAKKADTVYLMCSGIPLCIKGG